MEVVAVAATEAEAARCSRKRLFLDFLAAPECDLGSCVFLAAVYDKVADENGFKPREPEWTIEGDEIEVPITRAADGTWLPGWWAGLVGWAHQDMHDQLRLLYGGVNCINIVWLNAVKEEQAEAAEAQEKSILRRMAKPVSEAIDLTVDAEAGAADGVQLETWRPAGRANHIVVFFDVQEDDEEEEEDEEGERRVRFKARFARSPTVSQADLSEADWEELARELEVGSIWAAAAAHVRLDLGGGDQGGGGQGSGDQGGGNQGGGEEVGGDQRGGDQRGGKNGTVCPHPRVSPSLSRVCGLPFPCVSPPSLARTHGLPCSPLTAAPPPDCRAPP